MALAGKYSDVIKAASQYMPGKQLAAGDSESEMIARLLPVAQQLGLDPIKVINTYLGKA